MHFINAMFYVAMAFAPVFQQSSPYEWNKKSTFSTERQVEFPGIVLEPGVYVVKLLQSNEKRSFVQLLNQDETQVLASLLAVPDHRARPDDNREFTFHEVTSEGPQPVQTWYFAGDLVGLEFVYSNLRAKEIAKESKEHVMASNSSKDNVILAVTPNGKEILLDNAVIEIARRKPQ